MSRVTSGESLHLSKPQFPHVFLGGNDPASLDYGGDEGVSAESAQGRDTVSAQ